MGYMQLLYAVTLCNYMHLRLYNANLHLLLCKYTLFMHIRIYDYAFISLKHILNEFL